MNLPPELDTQNHGDGSITSFPELVAGAHAELHPGLDVMSLVDCEDINITPGELLGMLRKKVTQSDIGLRHSAARILYLSGRFGSKTLKKAYDDDMFGRLPLKMRSVDGWSRFDSALVSSLTEALNDLRRLEQMAISG